MDGNTNKSAMEGPSIVGIVHFLQQGIHYNEKEGTFLMYRSLDYIIITYIIITYYNILHHLRATSVLRVSSVPVVSGACSV